MNTERALDVIRILEKDNKITKKLDFANPLELMVATILSAQSTDAQINKITPNLFRKYKCAEDYANADVKEFENDIHSSGFYKNKTKNIIAANKMLVKDFNSKVPDNMEELLKLPGVGRKTANIILTHGFGKVEGIAVDTHVGRLSQRLGFTKNKDPNKIEQDLLKLIPENKWYEINHLLIDHGRNICEAKKPKCLECQLKGLCPSSAAFIEQNS